MTGAARAKNGSGARARPAGPATSAAPVFGCPLCGAGETGPAAPVVPFAEKDGYEFVRCGACDFICLWPMPGDAELAALYGADGATRGYLAKRRSRARRALSRLPRFLPYLWRGDALDLGCGGGLAVAAMGRLARRVTGLDISEGAIAFAREAFPRHEFIAAHYRDAAIASGSFDFVHASEIIEHVNDLRGFMGFVSRVTRPGGHVYITTPDIGHPGVPADIRDWDLFSPPRHLQFFTGGTLARLFRAHGFTPRRRYRNARPGLQMMFRKRG